MLLKKSSHPDPKRDNKQSACKLSLYFYPDCCGGV